MPGVFSSISVRELLDVLRDYALYDGYNISYQDTSNIYLKRLDEEVDTQRVPSA